jgi:hypothetical protein
MRLLIYVFVILMLSGCASTYEQEVFTAPIEKLQIGNSILIATPADGVYGEKYYNGSVATMALAVRRAFARYSDEVSVSGECRDFQCLQTSRSESIDYYVVPEILHWEDRSTQWSGIKDQLEIKLVIYDAKDLRVLSSTIISGKSKWATFGGDHSQYLLPEPMGRHVDSLY